MLGKRRWLTDDLSAFFWVFIISSAFIFLCNYKTIYSATNEAGDFAANSVLIQDAKHLNLVVGNYSRVGFNHPGPAILYVLAAGELIFHDWTGVFKYPIAGQLLAVCFYNSAWLAAAFILIRKISGCGWRAVFPFSVVLIILALQDYQIFAGLWMPHLYVLPFLVLLLSSAEFACGRAAAAPAVAISAGFLINGHVAFIPIIAFIAMIMLYANRWLAAREGQVELVTSRTYLACNYQWLIFATAIIGIFILPLIIRTISDFPGPFAQYVSFGGSHKSNSIEESVRFVAYYWGGEVPFALALLVGMALWVVCSYWSFRGRESLLAIVWCSLSATIALLIYAKFGIDYLDQKYIAIFYYVVPALMGGSLCILSAASGLGSVWGRIISALAIAAVGFLIVRPATYSSDYSKTEIAGLYADLVQNKGSARYVMDLNNGSDWGVVWHTMVGLEAYAKRRGGDLFCVDKNWHILFTTSAKCNIEDLSVGRRLFVTGVRDANLGAPVAAGEGIFIYDSPRGSLGDRAGHVASRGGYFKDLWLGDGWSKPDGDFVWTISKEAEFTIPVHDGFSGVLSLKLRAFAPNGVNSPQDLKILVGGVLVGGGYFTTGAMQDIAVPVALVGQDEIHVRLQVAKPLSPKAAGLSSDGRELGVALYGVQLIPQ